MPRFGLAVLFIISTGSACACVSPCPSIDPQLEAISRLDDPMIPLAKAVDVIADQLPPEAKDKEVFDAVVKRTGNPALLTPFAGYTLKARIQNGVAVILLCSKDGKEGIIEDVTCTTRPDTHRPSGSPCEYLLNVDAVCNAR